MEPTLFIDKKKPSNMTTQERREWLLLFIISGFLIIMNEP